MKFTENKGKVALDIYRNFAHVSTYLQTKTFAWKQDYAIFSKLQMLWR